MRISDILPTPIIPSVTVPRVSIGRDTETEDPIERTALRTLDITNDPFKGLYGVGIRQKADARDLLVLDHALGGTRQQELPATQMRGIVDAIRSAAGSGLSLLASAANVLDKPGAAMRGILAGDLSQLTFMLPFSESILKPIYEKKLGIKIPDHHISGREVLERWGAKKNKIGFHPLTDPADAVLDVLGLAVEVAAFPPYVPRIGTLTKAGEAAFRMSGEAARLGQLSEQALITTGKAITRDALEKLAPAEVARLDLPTLATNILRNAGAPEEAIQTAAQYTASLSPRAAEGLVTKLRDAVAHRDVRSVGGFFQALPTIARTVRDATSPIGHLPAASMLGRAQEMQAGLRGFSLAPVGIGRALGLPTLEFQSETAGKILEAAQGIAPVRVIRNIFDWTVKDTLAKTEQYGAQRAVEVARNTIGGLSDLHSAAQAEMGAVADMFAKYHELATLGNNATGIKSFQDVMTYIAEHSRRFSGDENKRYVELAQKIFAGSPIDKGMVDFVQEATTVVERFLADSVDAVREEALRLGLPVSKIEPITSAYFPRYSPNTPIGPVLSPAGAGRTIAQAQKQQPRITEFRHIPGGVVTINAASHDPILRKYGPSVARGLYGVDDLMFKAPNGKIYLYGDYVRGKDVFGRVIGTKDSKLAVLPTVGEKPVLVDPTEVLHIAPPSDPSQYIKLSPLSYNNAVSLAKRWLKENGVDVKLGRNPSFAKRQSVLQQYLLKRYAEPHITSEAVKTAFVTDPKKFSTLNDAVEYFARELNVGEDEARIIAKAALQDRGLSGAMLKRLQADDLPNFFANDVLENHYKYMTAMAESIAAMSGVHELLKQAATIAMKPKPNLLGIASEENLVTLRDAWNSIRFPRGRRKESQLLEDGLNTLVQGLLRDNTDLATKLSSAGITLQDAADFLHVPKSAVNSASRLLSVLLPENRVSLPIEEALNSITSTYRSWMTVPRLAFHVRNFYTNTLMGATADAPYSTAQYFKSFKEIIPKMVNGDIDGIPYINEMIRHGVLGSSASFQDVVLGMPKTAGGLMEQLEPIVYRPTGAAEVLSPIAGALKSEAGSVRDFLTLNPTRNPLIKAGNNAFKWVEGAGRAVVYAAAREAGMTPSQAKEVVDRVLYNYARLSTTEKRWIRPTVMFYSWLRQNLGYMVPRMLLDWKSGPATTTWAVGRLWAQNPEQMPQWLQDQLAIPLYKDKDGKTVVIKSLGLPIQDVALISPSLAKTTTNILGRMHPFIRTAITFASGEEPFTGLPAEKVMSLLSKTGINVPVDKRVVQTAIDLFPASSMVAYVSRLFDSDKTPLQRAIDFSSGVKFGKYDLELQRINEALEVLKDQIVNMPGGRLYEAPFAATGAPPETQRAVALYDVVERFRKQYQQKARSPLETMEKARTKEKEAAFRKEERQRLVTSPVMLGE